MTLLGLAALVLPAARAEAGGPSLRLAFPHATADGRLAVQALIVSPVPLGAYTLRLTFDRAAVAVQRIDGADDGPFAKRPITNSAAFKTGSVRFSSFQAERLDGPTGRVRVATIYLTRIPGRRRRVRLRLEAITVADTAGRTYGTGPGRRTVSLVKR